MKFYLGTHQPHWLSSAGVPLFVSARRLRGRKGVPRAVAPWALDSGGFSEIKLFGRWTTPPEQYAAEVRDWRDRIGMLEWAAVQDWMCEPFMLERTGLTLAEHQRRTVESWGTLRRLAPDLPWVPVLQGWGAADYLRHVEMYRDAGTDLASLPLVGVGSVCRRQGTREAEGVVRELAGLGIRLHGFGFKLTGLARCADALVSSDSMAWSFEARRNEPLPFCVGHINCANCPVYAMWWRDRVLEAVGRSGLAV